ncbi:MAG TPA: hypothetical protein VNF47_09600 [Streptosporangiaceae bacterium]|nr:hypothetical protein [Streptosporangiaceae bacterium]
MSQRLNGVGRLLRGNRYQRAPQALELIERIDEFQVTQGVPPAGGGLAQWSKW